MYSLAATTQSVSSAHMARAAIKHHHTFYEPTSEDPLDNPLIRNTFRCIRLKYQKAARKSKTLSSEVVEAVILGVDFSNPLDLRTAAFLVLQFNLMGRFSDVQRLRCGELSFLPGGHLKVHVVTAKNFEAYDSMTSFVAANQHGRIFSVDIIRRYLEARNGEPEDFLFSNFRILHHGSRRITFLNKVLSYDTALKCMRGLMDRVGVPGNTYTLHSVKSGSFSEAYNSGLVETTLLQKHARWVSRSIMDRYHKRSLEAKLAPTLALGINQ